MHSTRTGLRQSAIGWRWLASLALTLLPAANVAFADGATPAAEARRLQDAWVDGRLATAYALNPHLQSRDIDIEVDEGVVLLSGTLHDEIERDLALTIARGVDGVREVRSELQVDANAAPPVSREQSVAAEDAFARRFNDATATARVKNNLLANANTRDLLLSVDTADGVVTLAGDVESSRERLLAEMIVRNTDGIISVRNRLAVTEPLSATERRSFNEQTSLMDQGPTPAGQRSLTEQL